MKLIHCADLHLDSGMTTHFNPSQAAGRRAGMLGSFCRLSDYAAENGIRMILISGDLYDKNNISKLSATVVLDTIRKYPEIHFYYLRGNHDDAVELQSYGELPRNLHLFGQKWRRYNFTLQGKGITIAGAELTGNNGDLLWQSIDLDPQRINLVMLHGQLTDYEAAQVEDNLPLSRLKDRNIDYLALGHIHKPQSGQLDARGIWCYPGCLEGRGYDECGKHGFEVLTIHAASHKVEAEFVPFAGQCFYNPELDITGCMSSLEAGKILEEYLQKQGCDADSQVRITLVGELDLDAEVNTDFLTRQLQGGLGSLTIRNQTTIRADFSEYALDASLKGEFVRTVMAREDLSDTVKAEVIRYGIASLMGDNTCR